MFGFLSGRGTYRLTGILDPLQTWSQADRREHPSFADGTFIETSLPAKCWAERKSCSQELDPTLLRENRILDFGTSGHPSNMIIRSTCLKLFHQGSAALAKGIVMILSETCTDNGHMNSRQGLNTNSRAVKKTDFLNPSTVTRTLQNLCEVSSHHKVWGFCWAFARKLVAWLRGRKGYRTIPISYVLWYVHQPKVLFLPCLIFHLGEMPRLDIDMWVISNLQKQIENPSVNTGRCLIFSSHLEKFFTIQNLWSLLCQSQGCHLCTGFRDWVRIGAHLGTVILGLESQLT